MIQIVTYMYAAWLCSLENQLPTPLSYLLHHNTFTTTQPGYIKSVPSQQRARKKLCLYKGGVEE